MKAVRKHNDNRIEKHGIEETSLNILKASLNFQEIWSLTHYTSKNWTPGLSMCLRRHSRKLCKLSLSHNISTYLSPCKYNAFSLISTATLLIHLQQQSKRKQNSSYQPLLHSIHMIHVAHICRQAKKPTNFHFPVRFFNSISTLLLKNSLTIMHCYLLLLLLLKFFESKVLGKT